MFKNFCGFIGGIFTLLASFAVTLSFPITVVGGFLYAWAEWTTSNSVLLAIGIYFLGALYISVICLAIVLAVAVVAFIFNKLSS